MWKMPSASVLCSSPWTVLIVRRDDQSSGFTTRVSQRAESAHPPLSREAPRDARESREGPDRSAARPNGLPSESRQIAQRSPGWTTLPPSSTTRSSACARSGTRKYGSEKRSPGPRPRSCSPSDGRAAWVCKPWPSPSLRSSSETSSSLSQKRRARARSSAGNSISSSGMGVDHTASRHVGLLGSGSRSGSPKRFEQTRARALPCLVQP
jgi:hypothetical protein